MYRSGQIQSGPITSFDVGEIAQAYRYFSSAERVGKVVVSLETAESKIPVRMPPSKAMTRMQLTAAGHAVKICIQICV